MEHFSGQDVGGGLVVRGHARHERVLVFDRNGGQVGGEVDCVVGLEATRGKALGHVLN